MPLEALLTSESEEILDILEDFQGFSDNTLRRLYLLGITEGKQTLINELLKYIKEEKRS